MSTRVSLIIASVCLALAAEAMGDQERSTLADQARQPTRHDTAWPNQVAANAAGGTEPGGGEHVSNAPRAVSYAAGLSNETAQAPLRRSSSTTAGDETDLGVAMPLPPRTKTKNRPTTANAGDSSGRALITVLSSLGIVLAVFFAFVWLTRRAAPKGMAPLSKEVVESLGRAPLLGRQQMQLIRVGNKLVLLSVTATGADALTEITDPVEVDRLAGLCRQAQAGSISHTFRQILAQAATEPAPPSPPNQRQTRRSGSLEAYRA